MSENGWVIQLGLKRKLRSRNVTYQQIATAAGVSWFMVWAVLNGRKTSKRVLDTARQLSA